MVAVIPSLNELFGASSFLYTPSDGAFSGE